MSDFTGHSLRGSEDCVVVQEPQYWMNTILIRAHGSLARGGRKREQTKREVTGDNNDNKEKIVKNRILCCFSKETITQPWLSVAGSPLYKWLSPWLPVNITRGILEKFNNFDKTLSILPFLVVTSNLCSISWWVQLISDSKVGIYRRPAFMSKLFWSLTLDWEARGRQLYCGRLWVKWKSGWQRVTWANMFTEWIGVIIKSVVEGRESRSTADVQSSLLLRLGTPQPSRLSLQQHSDLKAWQRDRLWGKE